MDPVDIARIRAEAKRLADLRPGHSIELRIPPYTAVQLASESGGTLHRRGTPPTVVEMDGQTFLDLIDHRLGWDEAIHAYRVFASGVHADLTSLFA